MLLKGTFTFQNMFNGVGGPQFRPKACTVDVIYTHFLVRMSFNAIPKVFSQVLAKLFKRKKSPHCEKFQNAYINS
jgi:hypothetical protein